MKADFLRLPFAKTAVVGRSLFGLCSGRGAERLLSRRSLVCRTAISGAVVKIMVSGVCSVVL